MRYRVFALLGNGWALEVALAAQAPCGQGDPRGQNSHGIRKIELDAA